jgi:hypothetical protein
MWISWLWGRCSSRTVWRSAMESVRAATKRGGTTLGEVLIQCDEGRCCRTGTGTGRHRSVSSTALWC